MYYYNFYHTDKRKLGFREVKQLVCGYTVNSTVWFKSDFRVHIIKVLYHVLLNLNWMHTNGNESLLCLYSIYILNINQ